jgi:hypothetical protein
MVEVFTIFEFPIPIDEFLEPVGTKDQLDYSDFCKLFKSKRYINNDSIRSFATGFLTEGLKRNNSLFPVRINNDGW